METNPNAIAVGRLVPIKSFDVVLDAWTEISIPLQIVGDGPEYKNLANQAQRLGLLDRVEFLGERTDVSELMARSDLLVAASDKEGFSYVVLEALRSRLVVVATRTGVAAELVPSKYLIDQPNSELLAQTVSEALASWKQTNHEFESAWRKAGELTTRRMVRATESVYLETLRLVPSKAS